MSNAPLKLVHPRNKVIIPTNQSNVNNSNNNRNNNNNNNNNNRNSNVHTHNNNTHNTTNRTTDQRVGVHVNGSDESDDTGDSSGSDSSDFSDTDSEKSEEIPDDSDNEYSPKGKTTGGKRKQQQQQQHEPGARPGRPGKATHKAMAELNARSIRNPQPKNDKTTTTATTKKPPGRPPKEASKKPKGPVGRPRSINDYKTTGKRNNKKEKVKKEAEPITASLDTSLDTFTHDKCDAPTCKIPPGSLKTITWIQCDDCDAWYHVSCSGLTASAAKREDTVFRCGCL